MRVLAIESSCDETEAAVVDESGVLSDVVYSQTIHAEYGGVVPELAARAHIEKLGVVVQAALSKAGIEIEKERGRSRAGWSRRREQRIGSFRKR